MDDGAASLLNGTAIVGRGTQLECTATVRSGILSTVDVPLHE